MDSTDRYVAFTNPATGKPKRVLAAHLIDVQPIKGRTYLVIDGGHGPKHVEARESYSEMVRRSADAKAA